VRTAVSVTFDAVIEYTTDAVDGWRSNMQSGIVLLVTYTPIS
jgi:hypothetical protein